MRFSTAMQETKESSLLRTAYRFFIIGKFFGISCFSIKKDENSRKCTEVTRYDFTVLFVFSIAVIILTYENFAHPHNVSNEEKHKIIFNKVAQFLIGSSPILWIAVILKAFFEREKLWTVIFDIINIDKRVIAIFN